MRATGQAALGLAGPLVLAALLPSPGSQLGLVTSAGPDEAVGALAVLLAIGVTWSLLAWGAVVVTAAVATRMPGPAGTMARRLLGSTTPAVARRVLLTAAGVSVAAGLAACGSPHTLAPATPAAVHAAAYSVASPAAETALAASTAAESRPVDQPASRTFDIDLDWPISPADTASPQPAPSHDASQAREPVSAPPTTRATMMTPTAEAPGQGPTDRVSTDPRATEVVVLRGDTLWSIAASQLPAGSPAALIDATWRAWYATNADTIGADPNLIRPGQVLHAPGPVAPHPTVTTEDMP